MRRGTVFRCVVPILGLLGGLALMPHAQASEWVLDGSFQAASNWLDTPWGVEVCRDYAGVVFRDNQARMAARSADSYVSPGEIHLRQAIWAPTSRSLLRFKIRCNTFCPWKDAALRVVLEHRDGGWGVSPWVKQFGWLDDQPDDWLPVELSLPAGSFQYWYWCYLSFWFMGYGLDPYLGIPLWDWVAVTDVSLTTPSFTLAADSAVKSPDTEGRVDYKIRLTGQDGFDSCAQLRIESSTLPPEQARAWLTLALLNPGDVTTLQVETSPTLPVGTYTLKVVAAADMTKAYPWVQELVLTLVRPAPGLLWGSCAVIAALDPWGWYCYYGHLYAEVRVTPDGVPGSDSHVTWIDDRLRLTIESTAISAAGIGVGELNRATIGGSCTIRYDRGGDPTAGTFVLTAGDSPQWWVPDTVGIAVHNQDGELVYEVSETRCEYGSITIGSEEGQP